MAIAHPPIPPARASGKGRDISGRLRHGRAQRFIRLQRRRHEFRLADGELLRPEARAIEAFGQFGQRLIPPRSHRLDDGAGLLLDGGVEQAGRSEHAFKLRRKICLPVRDDIHGAGKLGEAGCESQKPLVLSVSVLILIVVVILAKRYLKFGRRSAPPSRLDHGRVERRETLNI